MTSEGGGRAVTFDGVRNPGAPRLTIRPIPQRHTGGCVNMGWGLCEGCGNVG